jgi:hypothetical protein
MAGHKMPQRTKRRLMAAGVAAAALIGTGVVIGISGSASAHRGNTPNLSLLECLPDVGGAASSSQQPPPAPPQSSKAKAAAPQDAPPADQQAPGDQPPMDQAPDQQAPDAPDANAPDQQAPAANNAVKPAAYQKNNQPPSTNSATAPDESGAKNPQTPDPQPQAQDMKKFSLPSCDDALGPFPQDFVNIFKVKPTANTVRQQRSGSRGTFSSRCGTNANKHNNPDNFIVAPGVANGAHHQHDYVGNTTTDNKSTNDSLAAGGTTCTGAAAGDKSAYYWPVIRLRDAKGLGAADATNPHNIGTQIRPASVSLVWHGNAVSKVVAMPQFLRIITGDAKAAINGGANANAKWTCTGFTNRTSQQYPICPRGSRVERILDFASCWDGKNIDSANHRSHVVFPDKTGACPAGTKAIPQLRMTLTYNIPPRTLFAVDAFPEVKHNPDTDHGDFTAVMDANTMNKIVNCINNGQNC